MSVNYKDNQGGAAYPFDAEDLGAYLCRCRQEHMVGISFRCWNRALETRDMRYYEMITRHFVTQFGLERGMSLTTHLGNWVRAVRKTTQRGLNLNPSEALGLSYDEIMAISMVAASQHNQCPALRACEFALLGTSTPPSLSKYEVQDHTKLFADDLSSNGVFLSPESIAAPLMHIEQMRPVGSHRLQ